MKGSNGVISDSEITKYDGIYIANFYGHTLAEGADGTPGNPVDTIAEAVTLATARNTRKLYFYDPWDFSFALTADLEGYVLVGNNENKALTFLNPAGFSLNASVLHNMAISGNFDGGGDGAEFHNCQINSTQEGLAYYYNCHIFDLGFNDGTAYLYSCFADRQTDAVFTLDPTSKIVVTDFKGFVEFFSITAGIHYFYGTGAFIHIDGVSCLGGTLVVQGDVKIDNDGTTTVGDYTNKPRRENPVNITAIVASETDFLNLFGGADYENHYTVDDLVLKCADPGANTVNVKLYKLVNDVLTNVDTFAINAGNFATYFNLMDMFGWPLLAGDNIKITVQATAGGPYAVTGEYTYRSA